MLGDRAGVRAKDAETKDCVGEVVPSEATPSSPLILILSAVAFGCDSGRDGGRDGGSGSGAFSSNTSSPDDVRFGPIFS